MGSGIVNGQSVSYPFGIIARRIKIYVKIKVYLDGIC